MRNKQVTLIIVIALIIIGFCGIDWGTGSSYQLDGIIQDTHMQARSNEGSTHVYFTHYADVVTDENMGMPYTVHISSGQYKRFKLGQEVKLEVNRGGITRITYYRKIR
jgi:hypothetical protein